MFEKLKSIFKKNEIGTAPAAGGLSNHAGSQTPVQEKKFRLKPEEIAPIALGVGGCLATDRIVVDGCPIGYMYRERPINDQDSGWRFFTGDESPEYMAVNANHGVYDVNTIINYDPAILPFIDSTVGSKFERDENENFVLVE